MLADLIDRVDQVTSPDFIYDRPPTPPLSYDRTSSSVAGGYFVPESSQSSWQSDIVDISFGLANPHLSAATDTSGMAQDNGGESSGIAASSEYVQQKIIYEAALSVAMQSNTSRKSALHLLREP